MILTQEMKHPYLKLSKCYLEEMERELIKKDEKIIGYCLYCKFPIYKEEQYKGKYWFLKHKECRNEELGIVKELVF